MVSGFSFSDVGEIFFRILDSLGSSIFFVYDFFATNKNTSFFLTLLAIVITIGSINWTIWIIRKVRSLFYSPFTGEFEAETSVVIPVYKEKKHILIETIESILKNNPSEIILVLDSGEIENMELLKTRYAKNPKIKPFFFDKPGKRPALVYGIRKTKSEIVVLVDSDTQWASEDFLKNLIIPFQYENVGGVGTRQRPREIVTLAHRIINWSLDIKYTDYISSDSLSGAILCLSGRTAAYRRSAILPVLNRLENDYFLWHKSLGGDDARLTTLVLEQNYKTVYQDNVIAESDFSPHLTTYLKQKVRWSRNSFRTYIKSFFSSWPYRQRRYYYLMAAYHTLVPGLTLLLSLALFVYSIYLGIFTFTAVWIAWAFLSRGIKSFSHLRKKPSDIVLLPVIVIYFYALSFIKLYAFFTMTRERWAGSRTNYKIRRGVRVENRHEKISKKYLPAPQIEVRQ